VHDSKERQPACCEHTIPHAEECKDKRRAERRDSDCHRDLHAHLCCGLGEHKGNAHAKDQQCAERAQQNNEHQRVALQSMLARVIEFVLHVPMPELHENAQGPAFEQGR